MLGLVSYLKNPSAAWVTPAKNVEVKARRRYSLGFVLGSISARSRVPKRSETTATGPIAISFELPIHAYTNGGTKLESIQEFKKQTPKISISMSNYTNFCVYVFFFVLMYISICFFFQLINSIKIVIPIFKENILLNVNTKKVIEA